jgi:glycosyltransferase involved in cell wall biosynthesis
MQDELQPEEQQVTSVSSGDDESPATEPAGTEPASTRAPAATASSYRDIIAERLARKSGGGDASPHSPMAHSSDIELSQKPASVTESQPTRSADSQPAPEIQLRTSQQEMSFGGSSETQESERQTNEARSDEALSSRERARIRQQERAALRRQPRSAEPLSMQNEEPVEDEQPSFEPSESAAEQASASSQDRSSAQERKDIIAERMSRRGGEPREGRRPERNREERGNREESRRREEPRREEAPRETIVKPRVEVPEGLTLRSAQQAPKVIEEPRRREPLSPKRPERTPKPDRVPAATAPGNESAHALASKLGISVVVPLFNEQDSLRELTAALKQQLTRLAGPKFEILYINDGSTDRSGEILQDILATSSRISVITFRRNLGKSAALAAGFAEAQYGIVITLDADLQDDPQEFVNLVGKLAEGYDLVSGWKKQRHDPMSKTGPSKFFNWVTGMFSGIKLHDFNCGLKAYRKEVTESLQVYGELHRYLPALAFWQGFRVTEIPVTHHPRKFGKSKFGSSRFFKGFLDLLSIVFTNRYGKRPLHLFGTIGTLMAIAGFIIDIWLTVEWALGLTSLSNRPILLLGLLLILVGMQLISIGLLGEMIVKNAASKATLNYQKEKGKPSAEARERRATRMNARGPRPPRADGRPPRPERRGSSRRPV